MPKKTEKGKRGLRGSFAGLVLVVLALCTLGMGIVTLSRYAMTSGGSAVAAASGFRFSSDYLTDGNPGYDVFDWKNGFKIKLNAAENGTASQVNVSYVAEVENNGAITELTGTINAGSSTELLITPTGGTGSVVNVSVSTTPYDKTLSAAFTLRDPDGGSSYSFTDCGYYCLLTIKTGDSPAPAISVSYPSTLAPDSTGELTAQWLASPGVLSGLSPNASYTLTFFDTGGVRAAVNQLFDDTISIS